MFDYFRTIFRELPLRAESDPGGTNFYIFVPSLGLPKTTARVWSSFPTAEKKAVRRDGGRLLIVYSTSSAVSETSSSDTASRKQSYIFRKEWKETYLMWPNELEGFMTFILCSEKLTSFKVSTITRHKKRKKKRESTSKVCNIPLPGGKYLSTWAIEATGPSEKGNDTQ